MRPSLFLAIVLLVALGAGCARKGEYESYPVSSGLHPLQLGDLELQVELAHTAQARRQGLMYRTTLPEDQGMLFVYPTPRILSFWMRNTFLPLSIAFLDEDGTIINIEKLQPLQDYPGAVSLKPARYALEVRQGLFETHGIHPGLKIELPEWLGEVVAEEG